MIQRLGYLTIGAWIRLGFAVLLVVLEAVSRLIFFLVPRGITTYLDIHRARVINKGLRFFRAEDAEKEHPTMDMNTVELVNYHGYPIEEHVVTTEDGYILTLHRIPYGTKETIEQEDSSSSSSSSSSNSRKPAVFLQHGLFQSSESWVVLEDSLPFMLADAGYDVWLGNNRGNRYCQKHVHLRPSDSKFWDFSVDEFALFDVKANVNYILRLTGVETVAYVGFSQGCAQGFASLSLDPTLTKKISVFVGLAPASRAKGLSSIFLSTFVENSPESLFLLFGNKSLLSSALYWRNTLSRTFFTTVIDFCCYSLFGWTMNNLSLPKKRLLYAHLYAFTSVKTVVHWFQVVTYGKFQMYDEYSELSNGKYKTSETIEFPISRIKAPIAIFYGGRDELPDFDWLLKQMPEDAILHKIDKYEHMDLIWADDAPTLVFPRVIEILNEKNNRKSVVYLQAEKRNEDEPTLTSHSATSVE